MLDKYFRYLYYIMGWSYGLIRKSKKKELQIYRYDKYRVIFLNDYQNRRLIVWFFQEETKKLHRFTMHFYYVRPIRKKITDFVKKLQEDENFWEEVLTKKKNLSYKKEMAFKKYENRLYQNSKK